LPKNPGLIAALEIRAVVPRHPCRPGYEGTTDAILKKQEGRRREASIAANAPKRCAAPERVVEVDYDCLEAIRVIRRALHRLSCRACAETRIENTSPLGRFVSGKQFHAVEFPETRDPSAQV